MPISYFIAVVLLSSSMEAVLAAIVLVASTLTVCRFAVVTLT